MHFIILSYHIAYLYQEQMIKEANKLLQNEQYRQAIKIYKEYIRSNPTGKATLAVYYNLAQAYNQTGQFSTAAECYKTIVKEDPGFNEGEIFWDQGQSYQQAKMFPESRNAYQKYLSKYPNNPECNFNLGNVHEALGEFDKAILCFQRSYNSKQGYIKPYLAKIAILKRQQRFQEVIKTCKSALKHDPANYLINYEEGMAYLRLHRHNEAISSLNQSISLNKKFVRPYIALGEVYLKTGKESGLAILQNCILENKDHIKTSQLKELRYWIGMFKMSQHKYQQASKYFRYIVNIKPVNELAKQKLVECLEEQGREYFHKKNFSDALECYNQALKYSPTKISLLNNTGLAFQNINNHEKAQFYYREVLKQESNNNVALNNLATLEHAKGNSKAAENIFIQITSSNPENFQAHANNGKRCLSLHRYEQALKQFKIAQQMCPKNNFNLFNDMAVTYESMGQYEQALKYANKANQLTNNRSPLILMNRASILMHMEMTLQARKDMDKASQQIKNPDKSYLVKLGINQSNLKFIFNQLNHYSYLMSPINVFTQNLAKQVKKHGQLNKNPETIKEVNQKVMRATGFAIKRVVHQKDKQDIANDQINPEKARSDYSKIEQMMNDAISTLNRKIEQQNQQIHSQLQELNLMKKRTQQLEYLVFKNIPESFHLRQKLKLIYDQKDIGIWQYGKQLYWILNGYLKGYLLLQTGVVGKGQNIDRSNFSKALKKVGGILQFAQHIPVIGQFSQLISKICGLFVDMQDQTIIQKIYEVISFNYNTEQDLNDEICSVVMLYLNNPVKISKIRKKLIFDPPSQGFLESMQQTFDDVSSWFKQKKDEFVAHMRGFQKSENIIQSELAVIDVGVIISIMLTMQAKSWKSEPALKIAANKALQNNKVEQMIHQSFTRDNQSLRVSQNSFCSVM